MVASLSLVAGLLLLCYLRRFFLSALLLGGATMLIFLTSGQGTAVVERNGGGQSSTAATCSVDRGLHLGFSAGGFDAKAYAVSVGGRVGLPVNRGLNQLHFDCGQGESTAWVIVVRGYTPRLTVPSER